MLASDFSKGKYHFKGKTTIWGNGDVLVMINHNRHKGEADAFLSTIIGFINRRMEWVENNRPLLENVLMEHNMIEQTEEWIQKAKDAEEIEKGVVYAVKGGQKVRLPLEKEAFLSGISVSCLEIDYQEDESKPRTDLYIQCTPDYFMDFACIQIEINHDDSIGECDILSDSSPDKPW